MTTLSTRYMHAHLIARPRATAHRPPFIISTLVSPSRSVPTLPLSPPLPLAPLTDALPVAPVGAGRLVDASSAHPQSYVASRVRQSY